MISRIYTEERQDGGFTLLELLIVISIIAILSVALVFVLNPAETLKKSRDAQRISDLNTMKTALGLYLTSTSSPYLGADVAGALNNNGCKATPNIALTTPAKIYYSAPGTNITATNLDGATAYAGAKQSTTANNNLTDGNGWIPVMFDNLVGGSPISSLPVDPINTATSTPGLSDYVYRYECSASPLAFEIDAVLESTAYTVTDDKRASDGGNNNNYYEVGTNLKIIGTGTTF